MVMQCDEIRERFAELLYEEGGAPAANADMDILDHLQTCLACRQEFEELKQTRKYLQAWKDEPPLRSVRIPRTRNSFEPAKWLGLCSLRSHSCNGADLYFGPGRYGAHVE